MGPEIPEIEYERFSRNFARSGARLAQEGVLELTYRCNLDCLHCYCNVQSLKNQDELSFEQICRLIDEAAGEGCLWLAFTGGEPLVREDFFDLYLYAKKKGLLIALLTNAALIDEKAARFLKEWPPRQVEISLYGVSEETHELVTRTKGSFKKTMGAIRLLSALGVSMEIKTMALTINKEEITGIERFARGLGARFRYDHFVHCRLNGDKTPWQFRLSALEAVDLDLEFSDTLAEWQKQCRAYAGAAPDCQRLYTCGAGRDMFNITPQGNLQTCSFPLRFKYDLRQGSFKEGWHNFIPKVVERKRVRADFACRKCAVWAICNQCPNWAYLENNDEEEIVDYICAVFKERAKRLGTQYLTNCVIASEAKQSLTHASSEKDCHALDIAAQCQGLAKTRQTIATQSD